MLWLGLAIGCAIGFLIACYRLHKLIVGTLRIAYDEQTYLFVELDDPNIGKLMDRKYVIMRVDSRK